MDNKELNLIDLIQLIFKNKLLFFISFILLSFATFAYVFTIEKTYKSSLIINMPLQKGIETEYTIESLAALKPVELNTMLKLEDDILIEDISLINLKHELESTFGVIDFITNKPDLNFIVKDKFVSYVNELEFFKQLKALEKEKNKDIINAAELEYSNMIDKELDHIKSRTSEKISLELISSVNVKEQLHNAKINLKYSDPIVEISYNVGKEKFKPSYSMLTVLALLFSFFVAFTLLILKVIFIDVINNIKDGTKHGS